MVSQQIQRAQPVHTIPCSPDVPQAAARLWGRSGAATGRAGWPRCFPSMAGARLVWSSHVTSLCIFSFHTRDTCVPVLWGRDPCLEGCGPGAVLGCSCSRCSQGILRCDMGAVLGACGALSKAVDALSRLGSSAVAARSTGRALGARTPLLAVPHPNRTCPTPGKAQAGAGGFPTQLLAPGSPHTHCHVSQACVYQNRGKELPQDTGALVQGELSPR